MTNAEFLAEVDLLREIPKAHRSKVVALFEELRFDDDEIIFRADDPSKHVYVVKEGAVALFSDTRGEVVGLRARIEPGGVFGEVSVLQSSSRTLSARASGATSLLRLSGRHLLDLARKHQSLALKLSKIALSYSFENLHSRAELERRREARIRIGSDAELRIEGRGALPVVVENLSLGGVCLSGVGEDWELDDDTLVSIGVDPAVALFSAHARLAWRRNDRVGIAFTATFKDHDLRIAGALHRLAGVVWSGVEI